MSSKKQYTTKQQFLKTANNFIRKDIPVGTQTGWREFVDGYVHYVGGHMENDSVLGVAVVKFGIDGNLKTEEFREKGHRHKTDGPAVVEYSSSGSPIKEDYYLQGINYSYSGYLTKVSSLPIDKYFTTPDGKQRIKITELEKAFGGILKKDSNGNITNIRPLTSTEKDGYGTINYSILNPDTIYLNENLVFTNRYDGVSANSWVITPTGELTQPRYYEEPYKRIVNWDMSILKPRNSETAVPLWIELREFSQLGIKPGTSIPEYSTSQLAGVLQEYLSPFNKTQSTLSYVYQDNFFHVVKDSANSIVYEKRIPLRPKFIKDNIELDISWESEPTTFQKAGYVAGITSRAIPISKLEFETVCRQYSNPATPPAKIIQTVSSGSASNTQPVLNNSGSYTSFVGTNAQQVIYNSGSSQTKVETPTLSQKSFEAIKSELSKIGIELVGEKAEDGEIKYKALGFKKIGDVYPTITAESMVTAQPMTISPGNLLYSVSYDLPGTLSPKETNTESKLTQLAKSDAKEVAKRITAKQITLFVHNMLIEFMTKKQKKAKSEIESFFASEKGKVLLGFAVGATIPLITEYFPEKYREALLEIGSEFRVQAETEVTLGFTETAISPFLAELGTGLASFELFSGNNAEKVRVDVGEGLTAAHTSRTEDETELLQQAEFEKPQRILN